MSSHVISRGLLLLLLLLALARYLPPYDWAFIGDDYVQFGYIRGLVEAPATFYRAFNPFWSTWYYRPVQNLWLLGNRLLFGLTPFPYYFLQGLWHLLATALFYALARRLQLRRWPALAVTALFALNAHHQDVVGWISSVATPMVTVFAFAALLVYLSSRARPPASPRRWALITLFTLLALLSHETGILLPPILLLLALLRRGRRPVREWMWLALLLLLASVFAAVHLLRPNLTLSVQDTPLSAYLNLSTAIRFLAVVIGRWTLLTKTAWGTALLNRLLASPAAWLLPLALLLLLLWLASQNGAYPARLPSQQPTRSRGKRVAYDVILRPQQPASLSYTYAIPLAWTLLHLGFVYGALWVQAPELLGGRHLYGAWAGMALLIGLAAQGGTVWWQRTLHRRPYNVPAPTSRLALPLLLAFLLAAFLAAHVYYIGEAEESWLAHARDVAAVEEQMKEIVPVLTPSTAVYARTFVLTPAFAPYAAAVWYGQPGLAGGSLDRLREAGALGPDTYLFDYQGGRLRQLLPALHDYPASFLLWPELPAPVVAGPAGAERLALPVRGSGWQTVSVTTTVPSGTGFYAAFSGPAGRRYRVRAAGAGGKDSLLAAGTVPETAAGWQEITCTLPHFWNKETTFVLEADGNGVWAMPRLIREG